MSGFERPRRNSARISAQRTSREQRVSSLRPGLSVSQSNAQQISGASSQPLPERDGQSNHTTSQTRPVLTQPAPLNLSDPVESVSETPAANEIISCPMCALSVSDDGPGLLCEKCMTWFHPDCLFMTEDEYAAHQQSSDQWFCSHCKSIMANRVN